MDIAAALQTVLPAETVHFGERTRFVVKRTDVQDADAPTVRHTPEADFFIKQIGLFDARFGQRILPHFGGDEIGLGNHDGVFQAVFVQCALSCLRFLPPHAFQRINGKVIDLPPCGGFFVSHLDGIGKKVQRAHALGKIGGIGVAFAVYHDELLCGNIQQNGFDFDAV